MFNPEPTDLRHQVPMILVVSEEAEYLKNHVEGEWLRKLNTLNALEYRELEKRYYCALYHFNQTQKVKQLEAAANSESKEEATQRLLFARSTIDGSAPILYEPHFMEAKAAAEPLQPLSPEQGYERRIGRKPKNFLPLFKSFIGASMMGFSPEPEKVYLLLSTNPVFARACGFSPKAGDPRFAQYAQGDVPSLRKLQQFDQIMAHYGLWDQNKWREVRANIASGVIAKENVMVGDTTHFHAYSGFRTVPYVDEKGKDQKKSQSRTIKTCRCSDQQSCPHPYELSDEGAGTIVKSGRKYIWGHKAAILGLPSQGVPLDAVAVADAATHDGKTLLPHVVRLFENLPELRLWIDMVLYDSACDYEELKEFFEKELGLSLKTSMNPRGRKTLTENLPKGMLKLTPFGELYCRAGYPMDYQGTRQDQQKFIYRAPMDERQQSRCIGCPYKSACCPLSHKGRVVTVDFKSLPHINPETPPMAKRHRALMRMRPAIERIIKRIKCDLADDRLTKRGNMSFQAFLDKTLIAFHILIRT